MSSTPMLVVGASLIRDIEAELYVLYLSVQIAEQENRVSLHKFPKNPSSAKTWQIKLKIGKRLPKHAHVCSDHFVTSDFINSDSEKRRLKKNAVPTQKLPKTSTSRIVSSPFKDVTNQRNARAARRLLRFSNSESANEKSNTQTVFSPLRELTNEKNDGAGRGLLCFTSNDFTDRNEQNEEIGNTIPEDFPIYEVHENNDVYPTSNAAKETENNPWYNLDELASVCTYLLLESHENGRMNLPLYKDANLDHSCGTEVRRTITDHCVQAQFSIFSQIRTPKQLTSWTGLSSFQLFYAILAGVKTYLATYLPKNAFDKEYLLMPLEDRLLLTLTKMKQNNSFTYLSVIFNIDRRTCSRYFHNMVGILRRVLENFIYEPTRDSIDDNMPAHFVDYTMCRYILDCTEIPVCSPKCIRCQTQTYSYYKSRHTIKVLIGCSPSGYITYVGPFYGGKASDKAIFAESGILEKCTSADAIMVDKGFPICNECDAANVTLYQPAFKKNGQQLNIADCESSRNIASAGVHIERVMERLKNFQILHDEVKYHYLRYMDDIMIIVGAIVNLSSPLLADDAFSYCKEY